MTKLIAIVIIIAAIYGGWELFLYWDNVKNEEEIARKKAAASIVTDGKQLPGLPWQLEVSLDAAQRDGLNGMRNWLKNFGSKVQDPRKAWVELDYCVLLARESPAGAKKVFAEVKRRTPESSPVWPRIKQLEKTYE